MNIFQNVQILFYFQDDADDHDCKLDLEDILDLDTDSERHQYAIVSINLRYILIDLDTDCVSPVCNSEYEPKIY